MARNRRRRDEDSWDDDDYDDRPRYRRDQTNYGQLIFFLLLGLVTAVAMIGFLYVL
jgi:hypothetical protein